MGKLCDADNDKIERGKRLQKYREKRGYSQDLLSERAKINRETISRYENGQRNMSVRALIKLCIALAVSADVILGIAPPLLPHENIERDQQDDEASDDYARFQPGCETGNLVLDYYFNLTPENRAIIQKIVISLYEQQQHYGQ